MFLALLALSASIGPQLSPQIDVRVMRHPHTRAHLLRITSDVEVSHVRGTEVGVYDLDDGRYEERVSAGPVSSADGFDGTHFWNADAAGFPTVEDHPDDIVDDFAWATLTGYRGSHRPSIRATKNTNAAQTTRLRFAGLSGPIDVTVSRATGYPIRVVDRSGIDTKIERYGDYRRLRGFVLPYSDVRSTRYATIESSIKHVEVLDGVAETAFDAPSRPDDTTLSGATTFPMDLRDGSPVVSVRIDDGPPMRMLFDSGGAYSLTTRAARRLGLRLVGRDATGGVGAGIEAERYATVRSVRIGEATLRDQTIPVFDSVVDDTDGTIGCEVLQRFAVRFDFERKRVTMARDAFLLGIRKATPISMRLNACTPEIDGSLEHRKGAFGIDTGSSWPLDVMAPYVRAHDLFRKYRTKPRREGLAPGGMYYSAPIVAGSLELGDFEWTKFDAALASMQAGAFDDPTEIGNVGVPLLDTLVVVFDYEHRRMWMFR